MLAEKGSNPLDEPVALDKLLKRPELDYTVIELLAPPPEPLSRKAREQVEVECKYEGYLRRQEAEVAKFRRLELLHIPDGLSYDGIPGLSNEIRQKLSEIRPDSLGRASRIPGMTPAAISVLMVYLKSIQASRGVETEHHSV